MDPDFKKAADAARRAYSPDAWSHLLPHERSEAIYRELRRIDMEHVRASHAPRRRASGPPVGDRNNVQTRSASPC
jgi:hypothetical protein